MPNSKPAVRVADPDKLSSVLKVFSALDKVRWDEARWKLAGSRSEINYYAPEKSFTADEKLLTHWLCYTMNRQMPFEQVWDVGGYVISHLVKTYTGDGNSPEQIMRRYTEKYPKYINKKKKTCLRLQCPMSGSSNLLDRLSSYSGLEDWKREHRVWFASRFMPTDALSIYRTLLILKLVADCSFAKFIYRLISNETDQPEAVRRLAAGLHFLAYHEIGTVKENQLESRMNRVKSNIKEDLGRDPQERFFSKIVDYHKDKLFGEKNRFDEKRKSLFDEKRLWCAIRDYLKSPESNEYLVEALGKIDENKGRPGIAPDWKTEEIKDSAFAVMELPGDVWNNNANLRDGLFSEHLGNNMPQNWKTPEVVRAIYEHGPVGKVFYPEQVDVTVDFVPRMCDKLNCHNCMFGGGIETAKLCHQQKGYCCPVTLAACGYIYPCEPEGCVFKLDSVADLCKVGRAVMKANLQSASS